MPGIDDLDSGWEDEEEDVDAGWEDPEAEAQGDAKAGPPSRELTPEERQARAARAAARKERHRAKAADKAERRKAKAAAAAAKQKKSAPRVSASPSAARPARSAPRRVERVEGKDDDVEAEGAPEAPARAITAAGARRNWRLILILAVLLVAAGGIAIALSRR